MAEKLSQDELLHYLCKPCDVIGRAAIRLCWNCGEVAEPFNPQYLSNAYNGRVEDYERS